MLQNTCSGCGAANPPSFRFCGHCGKHLAAAGVVILDRSGLIAQADSRARALVARQTETVTGKPFSLFVERDDLVVFYSHWNALIRTAESQRLELQLKSGSTPGSHMEIELNLQPDGSGTGDRVRMNIVDISERRKALDGLQAKLDLIHLVFSLSDSLFGATSAHSAKAVRNALEKVCLFVEVQRGFICRLDAGRGRLTTICQWDQLLDTGTIPPLQPAALPRIRSIVDHLRQGGVYRIENVTKLEAGERTEINGWHPDGIGALLCHLIDRGERRPWVVGLARKQPTIWTADTVNLVRFVGQLVSDRLGNIDRRETGGRRRAEHGSVQTRIAAVSDQEVIPEIDLSGATEVEAVPVSAEASGSRPTRSRMRFKTDKPEAPDGRQRVFAESNGRYTLVCPECGFKESRGGALFEKLGHALLVLCPCGNRFSIQREQRVSFRKTVQLDGYFAQHMDDAAGSATGGIWGPMVVKNLSRSGLEFISGHARRICSGDRITLRFHLDNPSRSLIKKTARVRSVKENAVRCQFEGADRYDVTLGFYFL